MLKQFAYSSALHKHGQRHWTKTGYEKHRKRSYEKPDPLMEVVDLSDRVFMVTGANSGIGKEICKFVASKGAAVYMVCRSRERAEEAQQEIQGPAGSNKVFILEADMSLEEDVQRCWKEFAELRGEPVPRLDALVCAAGALLDEKVITSEGLETTFATHLLFGTYLLGALAMPSLMATTDSRLVVVTSSSMYATPFPQWDVATSMSVDPIFKYHGQLAYAYAKRGQVLLCERWAAEFKDVKVVCAHPGWADTPGRTKIYGDSRKDLDPLRTPWEGAEGICWLCTMPAEKIESGALYLDRAVQAKHMAGALLTEGRATKNSKEDIDLMMKHLEDWTSGRKPVDLLEQHEILAEAVESRQAPLAARPQPLELPRFMGRWFVSANIPTFADQNTANNITDFVYDEATKMVQVILTYSNKRMTRTKQLLQRAKIENEENTRWALSPKYALYLPLRLPYFILFVNEDYSQTVIGHPDRKYLWIMTREPDPKPSLVEALIAKAARMGFDTRSIVKVPQDWTEGPPPPMGTTLPEEADPEDEGAQGEGAKAVVESDTEEEVFLACGPGLGPSFVEGDVEGEKEE